MSRFGYVMATYIAIIGVGALALFHPAARLIWNATASTPIPAISAIRTRGRSVHSARAMVQTACATTATAVPLASRTRPRCGLCRQHRQRCPDAA